MLNHQIKGPFWEVETGRRDGRVSILNEALTGLIPPSANISILKQGFQQRGLSVKDLVVLSGTIKILRLCMPTIPTMSPYSVIYI